MSRVGVKPIAIPEKVNVSVENDTVSVKGPLGALTHRAPKGIRVAVEEGNVVVRRAADERQFRALHGLTRSLIANMVNGVTQGYSRGLEIHGVGYNAKLQGNEALVIEVGFAKPVIMPIPLGLTVEVTQPANPAQMVIKGCDKQLVGEFAACIRRVRPPEPYQGKGVRYAGEHIRRKAGKTFAAAG